MSSRQTSSGRPLRILHIAFTMDPRGAETSLVHLLKQADPQQYKMDFLTVENVDGFYDQEIKSLGGQLIPCPPPTQKIAFLKSFWHVLKKQGPYDIVHAHPYTLSGLLVFMAALNGVRVRFVHARTDHRQLEKKQSFLRRLYLATMKLLIRFYATAGIAITPAAAESLFGRKWQHDKRWKIITSGINFNGFLERTPHDLKQALGLAQDIKLIGHVGSLAPEKNHIFLLNVFQEMVSRNDNLHLILIGEGPLRDALQDKLLDMELKNKVSFLGLRGDVPQLLKIMDLFIFPSLYEGMGRAPLEAQAAGLPCIISKETIPQDIDIIPELIHRVSLDLSAKQWADKAIKILAGGKASEAEALKKLQQSPFDIHQSAQKTFNFYEQQISKNGTRAS